MFSIVKPNVSIVNADKLMQEITSLHQCKHPLLVLGKKLSFAWFACFFTKYVECYVCSNDVGKAFVELQDGNYLGKMKWYNF
jgi:hypothetical protein